MFTGFWDKLVEGLAGRWSAQALGPALAFWGGGLLAWASRFGWQPLINWLKGIDDSAAYIALAVGGLLLLTASSAAVNWLQLTFLRLAEGYWPWILRRLRFSLARRLERKITRMEDRWQVLAAIDPADRTAEQESQFARLDADLAHYPVDPRRRMPTRLGNILRAAEEYPLLRYGLTISVCWPRLWLVLSKDVQENLHSAREQLNGAARLFTWAVLFGIWVVWSWWALPVALAAAAVAYWAMLSAAGVYGDLLRATFDLHRFALYKQLRWPLPESPEGEEKHGQRLCKYLFRGSTGRGPTFTT